MAERRKRNRTTYVEPGGKFVVYVPVDTPPIVCEFLNRLKDEGAFSLDLIDILTQHVQSLELQANEIAASSTETFTQVQPSTPTSINETRDSVEQTIIEDQTVTSTAPQESSMANMDLVMRLNKQSKTLMNRS